MVGLHKLSPLKTKGPQINQATKRRKSGVRVWLACITLVSLGSIPSTLNKAKQSKIRKENEESEVKV